MSPRPVLALDIGGTKLAAALVEADGTFRGHRVSTTSPADGPNRVLQRALDLAEAVWRAQEDPARPGAIGVSTKGLTGEAGVQLSGMPGWSGLRIPALLRERFPTSAVVIVNDVKAATRAEMTWGALRGVAHGLYVNLGTGIAAGIVAAGELVEGAHGAAGEIGYLLPSRKALARLRPRQPGEEALALLEGLVGGGAVPTRTRRELGTALSMEQLIEQGARDAKAASALDELLDELAFWIANVAVVVDPERIVLGGGFLRSRSGLAERLRGTLERFAPFVPEVERARFGADSALVGAGAVALRLRQPVMTGPSGDFSGELP